MRAPTPSVGAELAVFDYYGELQYLDNIKQNVENRMLKLLQSNKQTVSSLVQVIVKTMELKLGVEGKNLEFKNNKIVNLISKYVDERRSRLDNLVTKLEKSNPLTILKSGYSKVLKDDKSVGIKDLVKGDKLKTILQGGYVVSIVEEVKENKN